jgi:hypothetical protein
MKSHFLGKRTLPDSEIKLGVSLRALIQPSTEPRLQDSWLHIAPEQRT